MEAVTHVIQVISANKAVLLPVALLVYSEVLSLVPKWKSNGIVELIGRLLGVIKS